MKNKFYAFSQRVLDSYKTDDNLFNELMEDFFHNYGRSIPFILETIVNDKNKSFEDALSSAKLFCLFYKLSEKSFCYYSSLWLVSSWWNAYSIARSNIEKYKITCVLYDGLIYSYQHNTQFQLLTTFTGGNEKENQYHAVLATLSIKRLIQSADKLLLLFNLIPRILHYYISFPEEVKLDFLEAAKSLGEISETFLKHNLVDSLTLTKLAKETFKGICWQYFTPKGDEDGSSNYLDDNFISSECSFDKKEQLIHQDLGRSSRRLLDYLDDPYSN